MKSEPLKYALAAAKINIDKKIENHREEIVRYLRYLVWYEIKLEMLDANMDEIATVLDEMGFVIKKLAPRYYDNSGAIEEDVVKLRKSLIIDLELLALNSKFSVDVDMYQLLRMEGIKMEYKFKQTTGVDIRIYTPSNTANMRLIKARLTI